MISSYSKPQLLIRQLIERLPDAPDSFLNAAIIGPQYDLMRINNEDEKALMVGSDFEYNDDVTPENRQVLPYEKLTAGAEVDLDSVQVYAENLEGQILSVGAGAAVGAGTDEDYFLIENIKTPNKLRFVNDSNAGVVTGLNLTNEPDADGNYPDLYASLYNSPIVPGDLAYVTVDGQTVKRVVRSIEREKSPSSFGSNATVDDSNAANSDANPVNYTANTLGSADISEVIAPSGITAPSTWLAWDRLAYGAKYLNRYGDRYILTVTTAASHNGADNTADVDGAVNIRTASGTFSANAVPVVADGTANTFTVSIHGTNIVFDTLAEATTLQVGSLISFTVLADYARLDTSSSKDFAIQGTYVGQNDTTYLIKVVTGTNTGAGYNGAVVEISDTAGQDQVVTVNVIEDTWLSLGSLGLQFKFDGTATVPVQDGLRKNDVYYVHAKAATDTGKYSIINLNGAVTDTVSWDETTRVETPIQVEFRKTYTGFVSDKGDKAPTRSWEATTDGVLMTHLLAIQDTKRSSNSWLEVQSSTATKLFVQYRALRPAGQNEAYKRIRSASDIQTNYGKIDMENPLAFGLQQALSGSQGKPVFAIRVPEDNVAGYTEALRILEGAPLFYALSVMSYDIDIQNALKAHVAAMSQEDTKKWRRGYVGCPTPENFSVMTTKDGLARTATISSTENGFLRVTDLDGEFVTYNAKAGDLFRTGYSQNEWGEETFSEYPISEVVSEQEVILVSGPGAPVTPAARYELWRDNSASNMVGYVGNRSAQFGSRRLVNVWADTPLRLTDEGFEELPTYYLAAEIAGLRSAELPQQGLTRTEIDTVSTIPSMYTKYSEDQLNQIAANGTFIIVQEQEDGAVFIRHQLTTDSGNGSMYYEDSVGTNLDNISYETKGILEQYIGRRNTTPGTLREIFDDVQGILRDSMDPLVGTQIGPALISFSELRVWVDETLKDRVNVYAKLLFPLPINTIEVTFNATASANNTNITELSA